MTVQRRPAMPHTERRIDKPVEEAFLRIAAERNLSPALEERLLDLASDLSYPRIAAKSHISVHTVKTQAKLIFKALRVAGRRPIVLAASAAQRRSDSGSSSDDIADFLRIRFE